MMVINTMIKIFKVYIQVLQTLSPKDAEFRKQIIGVPFWAEGQVYELAPMGLYSGVLVHYKIRRGGIKPNLQSDVVLQRATL